MNNKFSQSRSKKLEYVVPNLAVFIVFLIVCFSTPQGFQKVFAKRGKGYRIVKKLDKINSGYKGAKSKIIMKIFDNKQRITKRSFSLIQSESGDDGERALITFQSPVDIKGIKLLTWSHKNADDDQWLFLPALNRVKRIASSAKSGAFMGSEFSYEDFIAPEIDKYNYKYIKDAKIGKKAVWVIDRSQIENESGYSKVRMYIDKKRSIFLKAEYYDRKKKLLKIAIFSKIKKYKKWYRANFIEMKNRQTRKKTELKWASQKMGVRIRSDKFDKTNLMEDEF